MYFTIHPPDRAGCVDMVINLAIMPHDCERHRVVRANDTDNNPPNKEAGFEVLEATNNGETNIEEGSRIIIDNNPFVPAGAVGVVFVAFLGSDGEPRLGVKGDNGEKYWTAARFARLEHTERVATCLEVLATLKVLELAELKNIGPKLCSQCAHEVEIDDAS